MAAANASLGDLRTWTHHVLLNIIQESPLDCFTLGYAITGYLGGTAKILSLLLCHTVLTGTEPTRSNMRRGFKFRNTHTEVAVALQMGPYSKWQLWIKILYVNWNVCVKTIDWITFTRYIRSFIRITFSYISASLKRFARSPYWCHDGRELKITNISVNAF